MSDTQKPKAAIAMSGGVDSSAAALLMLQAGYDCTGLTMQLTPDSTADQAEARVLCRRLCIGHRVVDLSQAFRQKVIHAFVESYRRGETPNPCVLCNRRLKFGALLDLAREMGASVLATGHYARIEHSGGRFLLCRATDPAKDQSYVLYTLTQDQLAAVRFPLGELTKEDIRAVAAQNNLPNAHKKDSQDICFIPDGDYGTYIERYIGHPFPPGPIVDESGRVLGKHAGLIRYTIGQRRGLGISSPDRTYVTRLDAARNTVVLGSNAALFSDTLEATDCNIIAADRLDAPIRVTAKIRYRHDPQPATVTPLVPGRIRVVFDRPQRAITPGQSVVLYDGDVVVGGGIITGAKKP